MKALKTILWCGLAAFAIQLIATVAHRIRGDIKPDFLNEIAFTSPYGLWLSQVLLVLAVLVFIFLLSRKFDNQRRHFVLTTTDRPSLANRFRRLLTEGTFVHVRDSAAQLAKYAALADYVYHRGKNLEKQPSPPGKWIEPKSLFDDAVQEQCGIYAEALTHEETGEVAIVFRGTDELLDVRSYVGSFAGLVESQYRVVKDSAGWLVSEALSRVRSSKQGSAPVVAVGHSLGGGLAQCLAYYAVQNGEPVIRHVYAFNSTPIVGVSKATPRAGIEVNLAFERAEILEYLRFLYEGCWRAFTDIKVYRFNFSKSRDPLVSHGMSAFWMSLEAATRFEFPGPATVDDQRQQREMIYNYITFHIGLYLATPPVIVLLAEGFAVEKTNPNFLSGLCAMLALYILAGAHAGWFMGEIVNMRWESDNLDEFNDRAFDPIRRFMHHWLYWAGVAVGLSGILFAKI